MRGRHSVYLNEITSKFIIFRNYYIRIQEPLTKFIDNQNFTTKLTVSSLGLPNFFPIMQLKYYVQREKQNSQPLHQFVKKFMECHIYSYLFNKRSPTIILLGKIFQALL